MKLPQFSIVKLMSIVGVVALNLAFTQFWSHSSSPSLFTGRFLTNIALQVGLFCLIRSRQTRAFPFWSGFEAFGLAAMVTSIYIDFFSPTDSVMFRLMDLYLFSTYNGLQSVSTLIKDPYCQSKFATALSSHDGSFADNFFFEIISFLPQFFIALIGGLLTCLTIRRRDKRHDPVALGPAVS